MSSAPGASHVELLRAGSDRHEARRLLLISPGFPPSAAVGGLRWQKMLPALESAGWMADVVTVIPQEVASRDDGRLADLPETTRVIGVSAVDLEDRLLRQTQALLMRVKRVRRGREVPTRASGGGAGQSIAGRNESPAPSVTRRWIRLFLHARAQRIASRVLQQTCLRSEIRPFDLIVSSGPPHSAHLAARSLAKRFNVPWIMDCRDPWTFDEFLESFDAVEYARLERSKEARCVRAASSIVANTPAVARRLAAMYPDAESRIVAIPNGADIEPLPEWGRDKRFRIVYAGSLFQGRDPRIFMRAVRTMCDEYGVPETSVVLQFVTGQDRYEGESLHAWARHFGVDSLVEFIPLMPRARLLQWLAGSAVNVLVQIPSTYQIPAKLFEYMQLPSWLIAVTNAPNAISEMLEGSAGIVSSPDHEELAAQLASLYARWSTGEAPRPVNDGRYDRRLRAAEMLAVIGRLTRK